MAAILKILHVDAIIWPLIIRSSLLNFEVDVEISANLNY